MRLRYHRTNFIGCDCAGNKCIPMNHERIIENISRSMPLRRHEIDFFTARLSHKKIRRMQYILQADYLCRHYTFVNEGCLRLFHVDAGGSEHILQFAPEDYWVADIGSFHKEIPTSLYIEALEPSEVWQIARPDLMAVFESCPSFDRRAKRRFSPTVRGSKRQTTSCLFFEGKAESGRSIAIFSRRAIHRMPPDDSVAYRRERVHMDLWRLMFGKAWPLRGAYLRYLAAEPPAINQKPTGKAELFRTSGARGARRMIPRFQDSMIPARPELETCNNEVPESYDRKPINLEP